LTTIGDFAFYGCSSLTSISIPAGVTKIAAGAFSGCQNLAAINVDSRNASYSSANGILFDKSMTVLKIYPSGKSAVSYHVPEGVTVVETGAFYGCQNINTVWISSSVTSICERAFRGCYSLKSAIFNGNPPAITISFMGGGGSYMNDYSLPFGEPVIIYYMPGTTGWGETYSGRPTAPWVRRAPSISNLKLTRIGNRNIVQFDHSTVPGVPYRIQCSSDLQSWTNIFSGLGEGYSRTQNGAIDEGAKRFYRTVQEDP
jgi:hypothetical protein